jgi:hypothetical protein
MVQRKKLSSIDKQSQILLIITFYLFLRNEILHIFCEISRCIYSSYYPYTLLVLEYVPIIIISVGLECSSSLFSKLKNKAILANFKNKTTAIFPRTELYEQICTLYCQDEKMSRNVIT